MASCGKTTQLLHKHKAWCGHAVAQGSLSCMEMSQPHEFLRLFPARPSTWCYIHVVQIGFPHCDIKESLQRVTAFGYE